MAHGKSSYEQGAAETYIAGMLCAWAFFFVFAASVSGCLSACSEYLFHCWAGPNL